MTFFAKVLVKVWEVLTILMAVGSVIALAIIVSTDIRHSFAKKEEER